MAKQKVSNLASYFAEVETQGDGSQRQVVKIGESVAPAAPSSLGQGNKDVATAGTAVPLVASSTACSKIFMTAKDDNTGKIFWGGSGVDSTDGDYLFPAQKIEIEIDDVNKVYIDCEGGNTDGVKFTYLV